MTPAFRLLQSTLLGIFLLAQAGLSLAQSDCVYFSFDDFSTETMGVPICGVEYTMVTPNWTNLSDIDQTDWTPWQGPTLTGATGPYAVPPFELEALYDADNPIFIGDLSGIRAADGAREAQRQFDPGTFMYVESTECCGNRAILESDTLDFSSHTTVGILFAYHMYGANMGSLTVEVSPDGGENWLNVWEMPDPATGWVSSQAAGLDWNLGGANLSAALAGQSECVIRLTGEIGLGGERSDMAIDNLLVLGFEPYPSIHNEGTFPYAEIPTECQFEVTFDKSSDFCTTSDHRLERAELRLSLNMGDIHRYGGTDFDGGVSMAFDLGDPSTSDTLTIADSSQPEELVILDITDAVPDGAVDVYIRSIVTGENPEYPAYLDDVQLDAQVIIREAMDARQQTVQLSTPIPPSNGGLTQFNWASASGDCDFPVYRFQLLRLHDFTEGALVQSKMDEAVWERSALTLEVGEPQIELTLLEGSGYYAWRVMPMGDYFPGGVANDLNWGDYSPFSSYSTSNANLQTIGVTPEPGVFFYDDPDEDKNRTFSRAFSRNLDEDGEDLLMKESVAFGSGSGFVQQTQSLSRAREVSVASSVVRSYSGMTPLSIMPVPLEKLDLSYEVGLIRSTDNSEYTAADFDAGQLFANPNPMSSAASADPSVGLYWSDENPDPRIPSAEGYPFSATEYTRDGTNRPLNVGASGHVRRLQPDGYTTRMKYGSVSREELVRIFGNEAPDPDKVEKVIRISPENVTTVSYVDVHGRTLATCLANNPAIDETKIEVLAPEDGFSVRNRLQSEGEAYLYEAQTEITLEEDMTLELDFTLQGAAYQSACQTFCRTCDYQVDLQIVDLDANEVESTYSFEAAPQVCSSGPLANLNLTPLEWDGQVPVPPGRYMVHYAVRLNNSNGTSTYLEEARADLAATTAAAIETLTDPLIASLEKVIDEIETLGDFYALCDNLAANENGVEAVDDDGDGSVDHYLFDLGVHPSGNGTCSQIRVNADTCKYDCNPATRDFEAFVTGVASTALQTRLESGSTLLMTSEARDLNPDCTSSSGVVCMDLSDARGWVPKGACPGCFLWDQPNNIAALNYGVNPGDFNSVMESMIEEYEEDPIRYENYSCLSLYANLEAISNDLFYYTRDSSIVNQLLGRVGHHFEGVSALPGNFTLNTEGWKTHPYKFVEYTSTLGSDECSDGNSVFSSYNVNSLDLSIEAQRDSIEEAHYMLWSCLNTDRETAESTLSESPAGAVNEENIHRKWQDLCDDLLTQKRDYFEDELDMAVDEAYGPDGALFDSNLTASDIAGYKTCYHEAIMTYVAGLCHVPSPKPYRDSVTIGPDDPSPTASSALHLVNDATLAGGFVRFQNAEWAQFSKNGPAFSTRHVQDYEEVAPNVTDLKVQPLSYVYLSPMPSAYLDAQPTEEDIDLLNAIALGTTDFHFDPTGNNDETVTIVSQNEASYVPNASIFLANFNAWGEGPVVDSTSNWYNNHTGGGEPEIKNDGFDPALLLRCGIDTSAVPPVVLGNGTWREGPVVFPGSVDDTYELNLRLKFLEGSSIDNLYLVFHNSIGAAGSFSPEGPGNDVLYPTNSSTRVVGVHLTDLRELPSGGWKAVTERFQMDPGTYWVSIYIKQELYSEPVAVLLDDIQIHTLAPCTIPATLYGDFEVWIPEADTLDLESCDQTVARGLLDQLIGEQQRILDEYDATLVANYETQCAPVDTLDVSYSLNYYQYTLYYYDPLGRLIRTVSPKGVDTTSTYRLETPDHTFVTEYAYNGLGDPVQSSTPDGGVVHTWYDRLQRPRFTQTAEDVAQDRFRYLCYDELDRLIRSGVSFLDGVDLNSQVDLTDWPEDDFDRTTTTDCAGCSERKYIVYDTPMDPMPARFDQTNLTNRISFTTNEEGDTTAYSYDAAGFISKLYQKAELSEIGISDFSHVIDYVTDPSNGRTLLVHVNPGRKDQLMRRSSYNEDLNLVASQSSTDGTIWHLDTRSSYFPLGQVKRTELGHYRVQGLDFTYNIHDQTIGLNYPSENLSEDPGQDGLSTGQNMWVPQDAFALRLKYHDEDFNRPGNPFDSETSSFSTHEYYDGSLSAAAWHQLALNTTGEAPIASHAYTHDELMRLQNASFFEKNNGTWSQSNAHSSHYAHDANGNLNGISRTDENGVTFDELTVHTFLENNQISHITDNIPGTNHNDLATQNNGNYQYDLDGRMIADEASGIQSVYWSNDNKIDSIHYHDGSTIKYRYNSSGHRIAKLSDSENTLYLPDHRGITQSIFNTSENQLYFLKEHNLSNGQFLPNDTIYPQISEDPTQSFKRTLGQRHHTIVDHVQNVRLAFSDLTLGISENDQITSVQVQEVSSFDYAPYGTLLTSRCTAPADHRYSFNQKEQENDIKPGQGNHYDLGARHYDPRAGRMFSPDPKQTQYPWQSPFVYHRNSPHMLIDFNGEGDFTDLDYTYIDHGRPESRPSDVLAPSVDFMTELLTPNPNSEYVFSMLSQSYSITQPLIEVHAGKAAARVSLQAKTPWGGLSLSSKKGVVADWGVLGQFNTSNIYELGKAKGELWLVIELGSSTGMGSKSPKLFGTPKHGLSNTIGAIYSNTPVQGDELWGSGGKITFGRTLEMGGKEAGVSGGGLQVYTIGKNMRAGYTGLSFKMKGDGGFNMDKATSTTGITIAIPLAAGQIALIENAAGNFTEASAGELTQALYEMGIDLYQLMDDMAE